MYDLVEHTGVLFIIGIDGALYYYVLLLFWWTLG